MGNVATANAALVAGTDGMIAQGLEAGEHDLATLPLLEFLPLRTGLVGASRLIAAGGIAEQASMMAALAAKADAV